MRTNLTKLNNRPFAQRIYLAFSWKISNYVKTTEIFSHKTAITLLFQGMLFLALMYIK